MKNLYKAISLLAIFFLFLATSYATPINQFINSVSPPMNANSVVKSSNIVITFEQVMNGSSMTSANVKVFGYQTGLMPVSLDFNSVANTLTINPVNEFKNGEIISVTITSGIKTISNQSITPFVFKFRAKALGGTGFFTKTSTINSTAYYISSGDFDRDGDIDLLLNEKIYKNNGNAFFSYSSSLNDAGHSIIADFDNDGDLDIATTINNTIYLYFNDGFGNFNLTTSFAGGLQSFGDLNGNGFLDVTYFTPLSAQEINILKNSNGILSFDTTYNINFNLNCNPNPAFDKQILINDMNNDGNMDLVLTNGNSFGGILIGYFICQIYSVLNNNGEGIFNSQFLFTYDRGYLPYWAQDMGDPKLFDNNNDGFVDINSPGLLIRNNGNGVYSISGEFNAFSLIIDDDFTGDGKIDILAVIVGQSPILTFANDGNGSFQNYSIGFNSYVGKGYSSADFDNDGDIDVAMVSEIYSSNPEIAILLNGDSPLPVELSSFTSTINQNSVKLNWTTSQEQNNSGFEIQRADDSNEGQEAWKKVDFINGSGNSNEE